jgi:CPA1 family monovalent cation:H+ antiporter
MEAANNVIEAYRRRLAYGNGGAAEAEEKRRYARAERAVRLEALRAERDELYRLRLAGELDDAIHLRLLREIDLAEAALQEAALQTTHG